MRMNYWSVDYHTGRAVVDVRKIEELELALLKIAILAESEGVDLDSLRIDIKKHFDRAYPELANPNWSIETHGGGNG